MRFILQYFFLVPLGLALLIGLAIIIANAIRIRVSIKLFQHKLEQTKKIVSELNLYPKKPSNLSKINNAISRKKNSSTVLTKEQAN